MKSILVIFIATLTSVTIQSQNFECKIFHSNGSVYLLNIKTVSDLGLIDSEDNYVSYKKIDSMTTKSGLLLEKIRSVTNVTSTVNDDGENIVYFDKSLFQERKSEPAIFDLHSMISLNSISFNFLSVQFQYRFSYLPKLYQKIFLSGGNSFSSPDYYSTNFGYGLGVQLPVENVAVQLWINCSTSTLYTVTSNRGYSLKDMIQFSFGEISYFNLNESGNIQLGVGVNLYVKQFVVNDKKTQFSVQAGINFAL